jgi:hypothetical protein
MALRPGFQSVLFRQNIGGSLLGQTELASYPNTKSGKTRDTGRRRSISGSTKAILHPRGDGASTTIKASASFQSDLQHLLYPEESQGKICKTTEWTVLEGDSAARHEGTAGI